MQLADWVLPLLLLTADDPHGRTANDLTLTPPLPPAPPEKQGPSAFSVCLGLEKRDCPYFSADSPDNRAALVPCE